MFIQTLKTKEFQIVFCHLFQRIFFYAYYYDVLIFFCNYVYLHQNLTAHETYNILTFSAYILVYIFLYLQQIWTKSFVFLT
ncbi:hypothetical protein Hanom_Chr07g00594801 [Helianthus anomalus]